MILSLAGIPLTAGFVGKFYVMAAGVHSNLWLLLGALALNSAIGLFYYLRFLRTLFEPTDAPPAGRGEAVVLTPTARTPLTVAALAALTLALLALGVFPGAALDAVKSLLAP